MPALLANISSDSANVAMFYLFAAMVVVSAVCVVISQSIVRTAVSLLLTLLGVAGLYMSLRAEFVAAVQLVVYAGGTLVLIVFGIMLTNNSTLALYRVRRGEALAGLALAGLMAIAVIGAILRAGFSSRISDGKDAYPVLHLGQALLGDYLVPFELISVLLLAVMIGAAYLAKARKKGEEGRR